MKQVITQVLSAGLNGLHLQELWYKCSGHYQPATYPNV